MEVRDRMTKLKNNQMRKGKLYKNDDKELVEVGQFLRDTTDYRVEVDWWILFDKMTGKYLGFYEKMGENPHRHPRHPDLLLIDKNTRKLVLVIEIDGGIHDENMTKTEDRNEEYEFAGVPLLVIDKKEIETTIFDLVHKKIEEYFE